MLTKSSPTLLTFWLAFFKVRLAGSSHITCCPAHSMDARACEDKFVSRWTGICFIGAISLTAALCVGYPSTQKNKSKTRKYICSSLSHRNSYKKCDSATLYKPFEKRGFASHDEDPTPQWRGRISSWISVFSKHYQQTSAHNATNLSTVKLSKKLSV